MIKKMLILIPALLLAGCEKTPESVTQAGSDFQVGKLFTVDGCTVYRFGDGGRNVYFSNCNGQTQYSYQSGGKARSSHTMQVMTNAGE